MDDLHCSAPFPSFFLHHTGTQALPAGFLIWLQGGVLQLEMQEGFLPLGNSSTADCKEVQCLLLPQAHREEFPIAKISMFPSDLLHIPLSTQSKQQRTNKGSFSCSWMDNRVDWPDIKHLLFSRSATTCGCYLETALSGTFYERLNIDGEKST